MNPQPTQWTDEAYFKPYALPRRGLPHNVDEIAAVLVREQSEIRVGAGKQEAILPISRLMRKLGKTTYRLWAVLLTMRDKMCETHPSLPGLARAAGMGMAQTAKSMARLRQFKLVEDFGFVYRHVPCSCKDGCWGHKVYIRNVYGLVRERAGAHFVAVVPRETARMVEEAAGQGGKRKGAGRPKKAATSAGVAAGKDMAENKANKSKVVAYKYQEPVSQRVLTNSLQNAPLHGACNSNSQRAEKAVQSRREAMARFLSSAPNELFPTPLQPKAQPAQASAVPNEAPTAPAGAGAGLAALVDGKPCDLLEALQAKGVQTIVLGGSYKGPRQRYTPEDLRAIASADAVVEVLRVPPPPKVREDHTEADRLFLLKTAYSATHEKVMRTAYWRPKRAQSAKEQAAFLAAAEALLAKDLSPLSWARFSFSQWLHTGKKVAPTPAWVWNAARIEKHSGWCRSATGTLISASPVPVPATRALMQRLDTLRQRLGWGRPTGVVVSEILPEEELQQLLRQQAVQRIEAKKDMDERIRNGEWVWG